MIENVQTTVRVAQDAHDLDDIRNYFEIGFERRIYNPLDSSFATEALQSQIEEWRAEDKTIVFTSGVYDILHANHRTFLLHTKIAAAPHCWQKSEQSCVAWDELDKATQAAFTRELLASDMVRQVVSIDGNLAVATRKGFVPEKGNMVRPIFDWQTRARDVLSAGFELEAGSFKPLVDAVTLHDNIEPTLAATPHAGVMDIAHFIQPDVWSVFTESEDIINAAQTTHAHRFDKTSIYVLAAHEFYHDALIGGLVKTSTITKRIGGTAVNGNEVY